MARRKDSPQKAAMREMMRNYLKNNDISIKDGTDVNSIMEFILLYRGIEVIGILLHVLMDVVIRPFFQVIEEQLKNVHVHQYSCLLSDNTRYRRIQKLSIHRTQ